MPELPDVMNCTMCDYEIDVTQHAKYIVVFESRGGIRIEVGCAHYKPSPITNERMLAVFSGSQCTMRWFTGWLQSLRTCNHPIQ